MTGSRGPLNSTVSWLVLALLCWSCSPPDGAKRQPADPVPDRVVPSNACENFASVLYEEVEPNESSPNQVAFESHRPGAKSGQGQIVVRGSASGCSNDGLYEWTGDRDVFAIELPCIGTPRFNLDWAGEGTDLDFNVFAPDVLATDFLVVDYESGMEPSECWRDAPFETFGRLEVSVLCWDGAPSDWELTISWDGGEGECPGDGDDDDSGEAADDTVEGDDDTAEGDDDTAEGDDDTAEGDDDSSGDDDDSIGDDDDSSGDDDDSSTEAGGSSR